MDPPCPAAGLYLIAEGPTLPPRTLSRYTPVLCCMQVIKRLPNLKKLDGIPVDVDEKEQAALSK